MLFGRRLQGPRVGNVSDQKTCFLFCQTDSCAEAIKIMRADIGGSALVVQAEILHSLVCRHPKPLNHNAIY
jgi:hypothetical protein